MAPPERPLILVISIGEKWMKDKCDDKRGFGGILDNLSEHADLKRTRTAGEALSYLIRTAASPPDGVLVTDPGVTQAGHGSLLNRLVAYARAGGTVVMSYCFSNTIRRDEMRDFWLRAWGLPWESGSYHRTDLALNRGASMLMRGQAAALQEAYSQRATFLKNVPREHSWYVPTEASVTQSIMSAPRPVNQDETAVAFAPIGQGRVGYTGDVNMELGTQLVVMRMFGL